MSAKLVGPLVACGRTPPRISRAPIIAPREHPSLTLQRTAGNRAVQLAFTDRRPVLQRACDCGGSAGDCHCEDETALPIQTQLAVNAPGDVYELEAERVAEQVMRTPADGPATAPRLQRVATAPSHQPAAPPIVHEVLRSPGEPLDRAARGYLEPRFGRDFGHVRVHHDAHAAESARAVNALAYTVGQHMVFDTGRYQPHTNTGRRLLAHETAHTIQQGAGREGLVQRAPAPQTTAECGHVPAGRWIRHVDVNQEIPQRVTWEWSDGTSENARCSSGKGHCCVGSEAVSGAACTERGSRVDGSNCTPVGLHTVRSRDRTSSGGVNFWTEFETPRSIALHEYSPVNGRPLSHGCVRLDRATAITIWCGSRVRRTTVRVRGLARPRCGEAALRKEWLGDFSEAGRRPADGERFDARTRRHIETTREELRDALGVGNRELDRRVEALRGATHGFAFPPSSADLDAIAWAIPRCVPMETVEEARVGAAVTTPAAGTPRGFIDTAGFDRFLAPLERDYRRSTSLAGAQGALRTHGRALWAAATARAQGSTPDADDRPLYWTRLAMARSIRGTAPAWLDRLDPDTHRRTLEGLLDLFEHASRGMDTATFTGSASVKRIVISGFDPFSLSSDIRNANPSGAAVLALDGLALSAGSARARVQGVIFPVRYLDFNAAVVERFFGSYLSGAHPADLIMTISMGSSADTELEEFAGRRRSAAPFRENLGFTTSGTRAAPVVPPGLGPGSEFLETTVSATALSALRTSLGRSSALASETEVVGLPSGGGPSRRLSGTAAMTGGLTAVEGAGGGFLSNEIFYRTLRLVRTHAHPVPMIHLHTPRLQLSGSGAGDAAFVTARNNIVYAVQQVLEAALPVL